MQLRELRATDIWSRENFNILSLFSSLCNSPENTLLSSSIENTLIQVAFPTHTPPSRISSPKITTSPQVLLLGDPPNLADIPLKAVFLEISHFLSNSPATLMILPPKQNKNQTPLTQVLSTCRVRLPELRGVCGRTKQTINNLKMNIKNLRS